jgi:hypothetical protein
MHNFDNEVNKILSEVNFMDGLKTFGRGVVDIAKVGASIAGAEFTVSDAVNKFLSGVTDNYGTKTTEYDNIKTENLASLVSAMKEDKFKINSKNDLAAASNLLIVKNFFNNVVKNYELQELKNSITNVTKSLLKNKLDKKIVVAELNILSPVDIKNAKNIKDVNSFLKWLFTLHEGYTYKQALTHFFEFVFDATKS